jgi:hypothetical protein
MVKNMHYLRLIHAFELNLGRYMGSAALIIQMQGVKYMAQINLRITDNS